MKRALLVILGNRHTEISVTKKEASEEKGISFININEIKPNKISTKSFNRRKLEELAASIIENGLIQPVILRKADKGYEIVAGERRWRACRKAGLKEIPCIIREFTDEQNSLLLLLRICSEKI